MDGRFSPLIKKISNLKKSEIATLVCGLKEGAVNALSELTQNIGMCYVVFSISYA